MPYLPFGDEPAIPLGTSGRYVAAAYLVFFALVIIYVAIMAARVARMERDLVELDELVRDPEAEAVVEGVPAP
jgi:hypothetical protein